ncbi:hypothetical protein FisN_26Lh127 [Fistulifera solaris]|uniref:CRAL-TRIO domain-containing protein n=1 Tax=Fistulifera solaris TaxID=1519565 RepID=A0A1Z5KD39_FISSO|nr:hypothetical protein FisN_26Lh127 [Fistulifera solaris]|eukprot:GAX24055.1 hypothetical protein FisN_26Lh127 [Fistulifera solaris]
MMPIIRTTSLIRGRVNAVTNDVYASPTKQGRQNASDVVVVVNNNNKPTSPTTTSSVRTFRTLSSSLLSSSTPEDDDFLGNEANLFPPQQEYQAVFDIYHHHLHPDERDQLLTDPQMIVRFYRASKGHVTTTLQQLRLALQWRREFQVEALCRASPKDPLGRLLQRENATGKIYVRGYDAHGRALVYMRPARENTHNEHDQMRHLVYNLEKAIACTRRESGKRGKQLEKVILLIDYEGWSLTNAPPMSTTKATLHILQHMYPERMYRAFCLHPPLIFRAFWNMVRPFIDPVTKEKIVFVSSAKTQQLLWSLMNDPVNDLEMGAGGTLSPQDFDSAQYLQLPLDEAYPTTTKRK